MPDLITIGETMIMFTPLTEGPLRYVKQFTMTQGGAESNVAIAFTRLGGSAGWISRVGDDEFGRYLLNFMRGEGVDVSQVILDRTHPTGIMFKQRDNSGKSQVFYYRNGSAASQLTPVDINGNYFCKGKILHLTGITPALSKSCLRTVYQALEIARAKGLEVSFDPNIRLKLWGKRRAKKVLTDLASRVDIVMPGQQECEIMYGTDNEKKVADFILSAGAKIAIIKLGLQGAYFCSSVGQAFYTPAVKVEHVVDTVGAGDGFAAGFLFGKASNWTSYDAVRLGVIVGALAVTVPGDVEGYPDMRTVQKMWKGNFPVARLSGEQN